MRGVYSTPVTQDTRGCYCIYVASVSQITESLDSIFESEKRTLDTTATIDKDIDSFPYHLIHNWVRPCSHLVSQTQNQPQHGLLPVSSFLVIYYMMYIGGPFTHHCQSQPDTNVQDHSPGRDYITSYLGNITVEERYEQHSQMLPR